jgi:hypothetical protein
MCQPFLPTLRQQRFPRNSKHYNVIKLVYMDINYKKSSFEDLWTASKLVLRKHIWIEKNIRA